MADLAVTLKTVDGFTLSAIHTQVSTPRAVLLSLHGITSHKDGYLNVKRELAHDLADHGIDSLRFDFRGHGQSDGTSLDFTVAGQQHDVQAALDYLFAFYPVETPFFIIGSSFGAPPALSAAHRDNRIKGVILFVPVLCYQRTFITPEAAWSRDAYDAHAATPVEAIQPIIGRKFSIHQTLVDEMMQLTPEDDLAVLSQPVLIIHGDRDTIVPYAVSSEMAQRHAHVSLKTMPGMDHGSSAYGDDTGETAESQANKQQIFKAVHDFIVQQI